MKSLLGKMAHLFLLFPRRIYGVLRLQQGWLSSFGQLALSKILTHDNLHKRNVGVVCVRRIRRLLIICCFTAKSSGIFGATFLFYLG